MQPLKPGQVKHLPGFRWGNGDIIILIASLAGCGPWELSVKYIDLMVVRCRKHGCYKRSTSRSVRSWTWLYQVNSLRLKLRATLGIQSCRSFYPRHESFVRFQRSRFVQPLKRKDKQTAAAILRTRIRTSQSMF